MALQWNTGSAQIGALPTADATQEGKIFQYTGETNTDFTNGYFYECVEVTPATDPKTYIWKQKNVQDGGGSGSGNASFELDKTNNAANITNQAQHLAFEFSNDAVAVTAADPGTYYNSKTLATKDYVDNMGLKTINNSSIKGSGNLNTGKVLSDYQTNSVSIYEGTDSSVQISKVDNDTLRIQGYGVDDRDQTKTLYDMNLAKKEYVDGKVGSVDNTFYFRETKTGGVVTYDMTFAELKAMYDAKKQGIFVGSGQNVFPFLTFNYLGPADAGGERILFKAQVGSNRPEVRVFTVLPDDTVTYETINEAGVNMAVGKETWYGTYTDENDVTYQVYTKTIYIPALPSAAGITTYPIGVSGMKQIISISGVTTDGFVLNAPRQTVTDNITIYQTSKGSQTFSIEVGKDRSSKSAYVTIVYAKNN